MEKLLSSLKSIPEFQLLCSAVAANESAAITGIGQINRSHFIAALHRESPRPLVVVCQDDMAAKRLQEELKAFLGEEAPVLPSRDLTLYDTAVVSRGWEQKRLRQLYDLTCGNTQLQILSWEALCQRTMPRDVLLGAAFKLETGGTYSIDQLQPLQYGRRSGSVLCPRRHLGYLLPCRRLYLPCGILW